MVASRSARGRKAAAEARPLATVKIDVGADGRRPVLEAPAQVRVEDPGRIGVDEPSLGATARYAL